MPPTPLTGDLGGGATARFRVRPGRYRLRVLMTGDAARTGRTIDFPINPSRAMEAGADECARPAVLPE